jgi:Flp pilus assembly pilin Flp
MPPHARAGDETTVLQARRSGTPSTAPRRKEGDEVPTLVLRALSTKAALRSREQGQTFAEYTVCLTAITIGILAALLAFSSAIQTAYEIINDTVSTILH